MRSEIFNHKEFWNTRVSISDETSEEYNERLTYIQNFEVRPEIHSHIDFWSMDKQILGETDHEYGGRMYLIKTLVDYDADEKAQDDYYLDEENIKKDMLGTQLPFDVDWYREYLNKNSAQ